MTHSSDTRALTRCCQTDDAFHLPESQVSQIGGSRDRQTRPYWRLRRQQPRARHRRTRHKPCREIALSQSMQTKHRVRLTKPIASDHCSPETLILETAVSYLEAC